jgi:dTDP-4-amino-4,6-dideoxygalactose transaminase
VPWFEHPDIGYNYRMSNVIAGIGRGQLLHLDEHRAMKKRIYDTYKEGFKGLPVTMNPVPDGCESNYWLSCILIERGVDVKPMDVLDKLKTVANAEGRPLWKPMHMQPVFAGSDCVSLEAKPVGTDLYERGLCLPSDLHMDDDDMKLIIETVRSCF